MKVKGVILAGGSGSRLAPLTRVVNKHLLPVGHKPMIQHCIEKLTSSGISDIMVITGGEHLGGIAESLGSGKDFDCNFCFRVQDEAGGIAQALGLTRGFVREGDKMCVILGDNIFQDELGSAVDAYRNLPHGYAMVMLTDVEDPERFGVVRFASKIFRKDRKMPLCYLPASRLADDDIVKEHVANVGVKIHSVEEKPKKPKSKYIVTGIYFYDYSVYRVIEGLKPSGRGELEITDVNNHYVRQDRMVFNLLDGWWTDAGTHESLARANKMVNGIT